ncbi:hypothetical protein PQR37_34410 [Paraburkholderia nemoris]|uniref:hypothetical protein n=1 Tax=Paraburkholderia TaxID=1822464 RepID=UPI0038BA92EB
MSPDRLRAVTIARQQQAERENRRLAAHASVAALLRAGSGVEAVVGAARDQIKKWQSGALCSRDYIEDWENVISQGPNRIAEVLEEQSAFGMRMRQNTPFAHYIGHPA